MLGLYASELGLGLYASELGLGLVRTFCLVSTDDVKPNRVSTPIWGFRIYIDYKKKS